jgi:hypothetical protein
MALHLWQCPDIMRREITESMEMSALDLFDSKKWPLPGVYIMKARPSL